MIIKTIKIEDYFGDILTKNVFLGETPRNTKKPSAINTTIIKNVFVNEHKRVVCVEFASGNKQVVKCNDKDDFDVSVGVSLAISYEMFGSKTKFKKEIKSKTTVNKENTVDKKTIRNDNRKGEKK